MIARPVTTEYEDWYFVKKGEESYVGVYDDEEASAYDWIAVFAGVTNWEDAARYIASKNKA